MPALYPTPVWTDGTFTTAKACSLPVFISPIPASTTPYVLRQDYMIHIESFAPLALNFAHPNYIDFHLVSESDRMDMGGGIVRWTRTYAKVPDTYSDFESFAYNFIGFVGEWGPSSAVGADPTGRDRFQRVVQSRIQNDFFLVGSGGSYATAGAIPFIRAQTYILSGSTPVIYVDWLSDSPPYSNSTTPDRTTYDSWMADAASNKWAATTGQIVAEDSRLIRWLGTGNIWQRQTRYVLAI